MTANTFQRVFLPNYQITKLTFNMNEEKS